MAKNDLQPKQILQRKKSEWDGIDDIIPIKSESAERLHTYLYDILMSSELDDYFS